MMLTIDARAMLEVFGFLLTPVFAAGGAWVSVRYALRDIAELKVSQRRAELRLATLYGFLKVPLPPEPGDSTP